MFTSARIKLTAWYLVIIMAVSFSFSALIYRSISMEFERRLVTIEKRFHLGPNPLRDPQIETLRTILTQDLKEAKLKVLVVLAYTNGMIFVVSSLAGYFLAGKQLKPIEAALNEQKRFVADASHELRTPLTSLKTSIEVALRGKKMSIKEAKNVLNESLEEVDRLSLLTSNLLSLARGRQNNADKKTIDLKEVVKEMSKKMQPMAGKKQIKIKTKTKSLKIKADRESIEKLITILLDNAIKYTPRKGKITISLQSSRRCVFLRVKDTGVGISEKDIDQVFERFYRVDEARNRQKADGFGLGLALAKQIVKAHRATISVKSIVGKGSTFTVKFPKA